MLACAWCACPEASAAGVLNKSGANIKPAPCADAIRKDQIVKSLKLTRIPTHFGCRALKNLYTPKPNNTTAQAMRRTSSGSCRCAKAITKTTTAMDIACPSAIGKRAPITALLRFSCMPKATAKSHPIPGLMP